MTSISPEPAAGRKGAEGNARLLDGVTGVEHRVAAVVEAGGLRLIPAAPLAAAPQCPLLWPWEETYVPASTGGKRVFATARAADARLTVLDPRLARRIRRSVLGDPRTGGRQPGPFRRRPAAALVIAATGLAALVVLLALAPVSAGLARLLPADAGAAISDTVIADLGRAHGRCLAKEGADAIDELAGRLADAAGIAPPAVAVVDWDLVNAFALPGQRIILTGPLLRQAEDPSEIAAVLAHEIAHVAHRDPTTGWIRGEGVDLLMTAVFGASTTGGLVESLAGGLITARYTRDQEEAADAAAVTYLRAAGIRSSGGAAFFDRLSHAEPDGALGDVLDLVATHPGAGSRADLYRRASTGSGPGLNDTQFAAVGEICSVTRLR